MTKATTLTLTIYQNKSTSAATGKFLWLWMMMIPSSVKAKSVCPFQQYLSADSSGSSCNINIAMF